MAADPRIHLVAFLENLLIFCRFQGIFLRKRSTMTARRSHHHASSPHADVH
jgi:hypothetical protein